MSEEEGVKAVLPHLKQLLSRIVTDTSKLLISPSSIAIESGLLTPANLSRNPFQPVFAEYSNHFSINFHRHSEESTHDTHDRSFLFWAVLDLVRPMSTFVEFIETWFETCSSDTFSDDEWDQFLEFLVQCQNLRFMQDVSRLWWERLCKRLIPAADENTIQKGLPSQSVVDLIPFDELQAFFSHRARIRVPLERIRFSDGVFQMDQFGEIGLEPEPWDPWGLEEGRKQRAQKRGLTGAT
ncbi:hypothetical protein AGABI1DRAFT_131780 [Agaricus bisporus var. burnettii JB137-S8]|uniref:Uncharacterized protein n=1 Tax=Agaricus bisporus var. burnettii (strain JB137-S8 / ATCC MYA-4627 / FGSC 10392) TaxID=597362 RepID=K5WYG2_AGABU|nr:uncharacterized protein AGABI1DRAFT_131780 [Agaricus bisporus var. burnettii JB137-S8]EKM75873.1 hypothetical protein AGABI1DRAFT_131780 [Agaricus bisporus var. burnettii JB137-S8]